MKIKRRRIKKRMSTGTLLLIVILLCALIILGNFAISFVASIDDGGINTIKRSKKDYTEISVVIEEGSGVRDIAKTLKNADVIDSELAFLIKCKKDNIGAKFNHGDYLFNNQMSFEEIVASLEEPNKKVEQIVFTINEGMTQKEIADKLEKENIVKAKDFMDACNNGSFDYDFVKDIKRTDNRLEGYLFPDTYYFNLEVDCDEIINKLLARFDEVYTDSFKAQAQSKGLTTDQVVTMASLIEKEIKYPTERATAASVIYNRLEKGMKLQLDSTVLYALGQNKDRVLEKDTQVKSDYNTYYIDGLPVGPISNPGEECIKAVLYPNNTDYLYYVVQDDTTGQHFFTADYNEFLKAKEKYVSKFN